MTYKLLPFCQSDGVVLNLSGVHIDSVDDERAEEKHDAKQQGEGDQRGLNVQFLLVHDLNHTGTVKQ